MEHIGDVSAISSTTGNNFIADPGLHRTLTGDGLATAFAGMFGGPANTTYGENTGVLALSLIHISPTKESPAAVGSATCSMWTQGTYRGPPVLSLIHISLNI